MDLELPQKPRVEEEHAAALDKSPEPTGADATEPAGDALGAVDEAEAAEDGRGLQLQGAGFGAMRAGGRGGDVALLRVGVLHLGDGLVDLRL